MQTRIFILFLSTLALLTTSAVAKLGPEDTFTGPNNLFGERSIPSTSEWVDDQELQSFIEGRLGDFVDADFKLEGTSLAEKLDFLADKDIFPLIETPLTSQELLKKKIQQLFTTHSKDIAEGKSAEFLEEVRIAVKRHITAVLLKGDENAEDSLKMAFNDVVTTVSQMKTTIVEQENKQKSVLKSNFESLYKNLSNDYWHQLYFLNAEFKNYMSKPENYLITSIKNLLNSLLKTETNLEQTKERFNTLVLAYIKQLKLDPLQLILTVNEHTWENKDEPTNFVERKRLQASVYQTFFKNLLENKETEKAQTSFTNLFVKQFLGHGKTSIAISQNYCSYFKLNYEKKGLKFASQENTVRENNLLTLEVADLLFSFYSCNSNELNLTDLEATIEHLEDLVFLEERQRLTLNIFPQFLKIKEIDVASNFEIFDAFYNLYLGLRVDVGFTPTVEGQLEVEMDNYLDLLTPKESTLATESFRNYISKFYVMMKIMIAMPGNYPSVHIIQFKSDNIEVYDLFASQIRTINYEQMRKFVATLFSDIFTEDLEFQNEDSKLLFINREITLEDVQKSIKIDIASNSFE